MRTAPPAPRLRLYPVRILLNFMYRDGWSVHCIGPDHRIQISPWFDVASESVLRRLLRASGATEAIMADVEADIRRWNRGSVWIDVLEQGKRLLRLRAENRA
jgi:hypothetical protein